ncbi:MAG TPA: NAD(P)-dependent oxidoreductase [Pirellulales bacterium]|jgi:3-hydroxyisobutyrate dehydrogenase-like beta-hydroxyacid dehydrogenase
MHTNGLKNGQANGRANDDAIGIIGLGLLGGAISQRLTELGHIVVGYDIDPQRRFALAADGVKVVSSGSEVVSFCNRVILSLPNSEIVSLVIDEVSAALRPGQYIVDTTTGEPESVTELATDLALRDVNFLDATVAGSSSQARSGDVLLLVGAEPHSFEACKALLGQLGREVYHIGPPGAGAKLKLVHNLVLGLNRAVLAEGLSFARSLGLDPQRTLEVLSASAAYSRVMDQKGQRMVSSNFEPEARLSQHLKDVRLMLDAGLVAGAHLPLCETHRALLEASEAAGWGRMDNSAIIRAFETGAARPD